MVQTICDFVLDSCNMYSGCIQRYPLCPITFGSKYSRMDQVEFVEDRL